MAEDRASLRPTSLRTKLLRWLVIPLVTVNLAGAAAAYWLAWIPAQTALDQSLADAAWALVPHMQDSGSTLELELSNQAEQVLRVDHFDEVYFVVRDMQGKTIAGDLDFPALQVPDKINVYVPYGTRMRGDDVRAITLRTVVSGETILIGVAETRIKRQQIRLRILWSLLALELLLVVLIPTLIWFGLNQGFLPLRHIRDGLDRRQPDDLSPLPMQGTPQEIISFARSMSCSSARRTVRAPSRTFWPMSPTSCAPHWLASRLSSNGCSSGNGRIPRCHRRSS